MPNHSHPNENHRFEPGTKIHDLSPQQLEAAGQHAVRELREKGLLTGESVASELENPTPATNTNPPTGKPAA